MIMNQMPVGYTIGQQISTIDYDVANRPQWIIRAANAKHNRAADR
jgi:hypothetical protein